MLIMNGESLKIITKEYSFRVEDKILAKIKELVGKKVKMPNGSNMTPESALFRVDDEDDLYRYICELLSIALGKEVTGYEYYNGIVIDVMGIK